MCVVVNRSKNKKTRQIYNSVLLRESYLEGGKVETAVMKVRGKITRLKIGDWLKVEVDGRSLVLTKDEDALKKA